MRPPRETLIGIVLLLALLGVACGGDGAGGEETPTVTAGPTAIVSPTAAPDIREQDPTQHPVMQEYLSTAGGEVDVEAITYADLTQDGVEEAIVPVSSGGEGGNTAIFVFGYGAGGLAAILRVQPAYEHSIQSEVVGGQLVTTEPVFGANDPLCCPSELRKITYGWNGTELAQVGAETVPADATEPGG